MALHPVEHTPAACPFTAWFSSLYSHCTFNLRSNGCFVEAGGLRYEPAFLLFLAAFIFRDFHKITFLKTPRKNFVYFCV